LNVSAAGAMGGSYAAMVLNAVQVFGTVVRVKPETFVRIVELPGAPLIVRSRGGFLSSSSRHLTSYKGLAFVCKTKEEIPLPAIAELIVAEKISVPDLLDGRPVCPGDSEVVGQQGW